MKDFFQFLWSLCVLWMFLFALGTILVVTFFPLIIPGVMAAKWIWSWHL